MKIGFILLLVSVGITSAQTNTKSTPIFISFTNSLGDYVTNAEVVSWSANKLIYRTEGGLGGGTIHLDKLPPELQAKFNYNPEAAAKADLLESERKLKERTAQAEQREQLQLLADREANREKMNKQATKIEGRVIQTLDKGVLISCFSSRDRSFFPDEIYKSWQSKNLFGTLDEAENIIFLVDYPFKNQLAADDTLGTVAYPDGFYKYSTVNHSENTVRRYTSSLDQAVMDWQPNAINGKIYP
jgi:hypothetical protein